MRPASRMRRSSSSPSGAGAYSRTSRRLAMASQASTAGSVPVRATPGRWSGSGRDVREAVRVRPLTSLFATVEVVDLPGVLRRELEVEDLEVLPDARRRRGLREHDARALE